MKTKKDQKSEEVAMSADLTIGELQTLYFVLQSCTNNPGVQPATVFYCRKVKKQALAHIQAYETELPALMDEHKVPKTETAEGVSFDWSGMKKAEFIEGLVRELNAQTYKLDNLNALTQTEFIKHTRGLSEDQMDVFEKYLVKGD